MKNNMSQSNDWGEYYSAFFYMKLPELCDSPEEYLKLDAFIHEFIHYLQDLNLPYCIRETLGQMDKLQNVREYAEKHDGKIPIPFRAWDSNASLLNEQFERISGEGFRTGIISGRKNNHIAGKPDATVIHREVDSEAYGHRSFDIQDYTVYTENGATYSLGARDFLEYIARQIQVKHFPDSKPLDYLPYNTIDQLFEKYGFFDISDEMKVNIVETCLYNDHPMNYLDVYLKNADFIRNSSYNKLYTMNLNLIFETRDGKREQLKQKRERRWKDFWRVLGQTTYQQFPDIVTWLGKVNQFAKTNWKNRFLFSDLYQADGKNFRKEIRRIMRHIGLPLIITSDFRFQTIGNDGIKKEAFVPFYLCQRFMECVENDNTDTNPLLEECPVQEFCYCNGEEEPWFPQYGGLPCTHYKKTSGDCPYRCFLNAFGLNKNAEV